MVDAPLNVPERSEDPTSHRRPALGYALVLAAIALWSVNATVAKIVVDSGGLSALRLAEVRGTGAAILLFAGVAIFAPRTLRVTRRELGYLAIFGICGLAFVHFFYFTAITHLDIGIALVIQYLAPVLVALWARFFVHEPVRRRLWYALALAFGGLTLVAEIWSGGGTLDGVGVAAALAGAFAYALYILMAEHSVRGGRDVYSLLAWGFAFAALFWAVVATVVELPGRCADERRLAARPAGGREPPGLALDRLHRRPRDGRAVHLHGHGAPPHPRDARDRRRDGGTGAGRSRRLRLARGEDLGRNSWSAASWCSPPSCSPRRPEGLSSHSEEIPELGELLGAEFLALAALDRADDLLDLSREAPPG